MQAQAGGTGGASAAADRLAEAHARLLQDPTLQFAFTSRVPPKPPSWLEPLARLLEAVAPILKWVFWIGVAAGLAAVVFFIARELIRIRWPARKKPTAVPAGAPEWRPEPEQARALLQDADRLAGEGRYAEAVHLLLHRSIDDIEGRRPRAVRPALTARDIARLDSLPERARGPFRAIAGAVERSFFGGRELDATAFAECRRAYEAFAFPEAWA